DSCKLFVKNLHPHVSHSELFQTFKPFGYIYSAKVNIDEQIKVSKGTGLVIFANPDDVTNAISALIGHELKGQKI
ncbi:RRM domain protein, partial [Dimargaris cristalligena]